MNSPRTVAWVATVIAILALGYAGLLQKKVMGLRAELAARTHERDTLRDGLQQTNRNSQALRDRLAATETRTSRAPQAPERSAPPPAPPPGARNGSAASGALADREVLERLAALKPLLQAGTPIRGAIVTHVNGSPAERRVEFVVGRETIIEGVDDGIYYITPSLNEDGTVRYSVSLQRKDAPPGVDGRQTLPAVIAVPWMGFTVGTRTGQALAFDPDEE